MLPFSLRRRILSKFAQAKTLPPPPSLPGDLFAGLNNGYNGGTVALIKGMVNYLNTALHYASQGKDSIQNIVNNNSNLSAAYGNYKNIGMISKKVFNTFLNNKESFNEKVSGTKISEWANEITNMPEFNDLTKIKANEMTSIKIQGNLKNILTDYLNGIKSQNPVVA